MEKGLLGLHQLETLYQIICDPKGPRNRTPPQFSGTLAEGLGPFSPLISIYNQLLDWPIQGSADDHQVGGVPKKPVFHGPEPFPIREASISPTPEGISAGDSDMEDIEMEDDEYQLASTSSSQSPPVVPPEPGDDEPPRRTPTETLVVDFLVILLTGLASLIQGLGAKPLCMANSFETTYTFGPIHNTSQSQGNVQFRARIDGSIPFALSLSGIIREAAIFEAKRAVRGDSRGGVPVLAQQSMEHVAYIWKRHEHDQTWRGKGKKYHTFLVAQDHLQFHISIGTYSTKYLEYIFGPGNQAVVPAESEGFYLEIQEFGPFDVADREELKAFLHIMLSFLIRQFEKTNSGAFFKAALSGSL